MPTTPGYRIEVERRPDSRFGRSMAEELAWAISKAVGRGDVSATITMTTPDVQSGARQLRFEYGSQLPIWVPHSLERIPAQNWTDNDVMTVCLGNATLRCNFFSGDASDIVINPNLDGTVSYRVTLTHKPAQNFHQPMRSG